MKHVVEVDDAELQGPCGFSSPSNTKESQEEKSFKQQQTEDHMRKICQTTSKNTSANIELH